MGRMTHSIGTEAPYRISSRRVISAFRTVSADAAVVITGMMTLKLVVDVERRKRDLSNNVQLVEDAMEKWQQDWANSYKGRWT